MNRRDYLLLQFSGVVTFLLAACKPDEKESVPIIKEPEQKLLLIRHTVPDLAIAGGTLEIVWEAENIESLSVYTKIGIGNWIIVAEKVDAKIKHFTIPLPSKFEKDDFLSIKLTGDGLEAIKENIKTEYTPPYIKTIEIIKIEPEEAIAGEKLKVFFKAENITTLLVELRNTGTDLLEIRNIAATNEFYELTMPDSFDSNEKLSITLSAEGISAILENIKALNAFKINTDDHSELKIIGGFQKITLPPGEIWLKRVSVNEMKAFSAYCTHAGCGIDFLKTENHFYCSCHGSKFSSEGMVLNGPASTPLNEYKCRFVSDELFSVLY